MFARLRKDLAAARARDPAARSNVEVLLCYPGFHAVMVHRLAHWLWRRHYRLTARFLSEVSRLFTGIEIHPGATIGEGLFIDHGMGVVIGETSELGDNVTLYQGATLGGTGKESGKRHPTLGDNVVVGVGAKILGSVTIGSNSLVGAGAVVLTDVPPDCTAVGVPARIVREQGRPIPGARLSGGAFADPIAEVLSRLTERVEQLEKQAQTSREGP